MQSHIILGPQKDLTYQSYYYELEVSFNPAMRKLQTGLHMDFGKGIHLLTRISGWG